MDISVTPLGAGQQVGRSCLLVQIGDKSVLLDCGISPGAKWDAERFPEFERNFSRTVPADKVIDAVIISHYHLDHVGALPYFSEKVGFNGPILMTYPTRAVSPVICRDFIRLIAKKGKPWYSSADVDSCFQRVRSMHLHERVDLDGLAITPFYAGHVLGAAMILIEYRGSSVLYTGDFTMVTENYLSAARFPLVQSFRPDVLITETTCCTTLRSSNRVKEMDFCRKLEDALRKGGKVLIPTSTLGRAQELCLICDKYWEQAGLKFPMILVRGLAEKGLEFMRLFASWSSDLVRNTEEPFNFKHVRFGSQQDVIDIDSPVVVFCGPQSMQGGLALQLFKEWAPGVRNLICFTGYCLPGTIGNAVQAKVPQVRIDSETVVEVKCGVDYLSHSDHTDSRGILQLITEVRPRNTVLVHGAESIITSFQAIVEKRLKVPCFAPSLGQRLVFPAPSGPQSAVHASPVLLHKSVTIASPPLAPPSCASVPGVALRTIGSINVPAFPPSPAFSFSGRVWAKRNASTPIEILEADSQSSEGNRIHRVQFLHEAHAMPVAQFERILNIFQGKLSSKGLAHEWRPFEPNWKALRRGTDERWDSRCPSSELHLLRSSGFCSVTVSSSQTGTLSVGVRWSHKDDSDVETTVVEQLVDLIG